MPLEYYPFGLRPGCLYLYTGCEHQWLYGCEEIFGGRSPNESIP